jgi:signal transduction histidine kinase
MLLQNAEKNISNPDFQKEALVTISKAVNRQKKIISRLTEERADDKLSLETVKLADLMADTVERVRLETVKSVSVSAEVDPDIKVIVDRDKIGSVLDNLIMNALEAMPDGGRLELKSIVTEGRDLIGLSIKDSGVGMTQEFIATRLFKPFSSTKPYGLGIGMFQTREIVKAHRGRIEVNSRPGEGSEFIIYLPGEG